MTEPITAAREALVTPARGGATKRVLQVVVSVAIVVGIFAFAIPRIADYSAVWGTMSDLSWLELWSLIGITVLNLATYWFANMAALPGLTLGKSAVLTQTTTSVANTLPAGGAVAVGLTYTILRSWGFHRQSIALYVGVTGVWNIFLKLALPIFALSLLALVGGATAALVVAALVGLGVLGAAVTLFALALWKKEFARRIGDGLGRAASALRRIVRRPPIRDWGEHAVAFRKRTIALVVDRWPWLTLTTVVSHLMLWVVLLAALRHVGVSQQEVSTLETLAVFAFGRLLTALPITPGGLGVIELGYIGGLVAAGGNEPQVVAAVLLFRVLTYGVPIPLGGATYLVWRGRSSWRRSEAPTPTATPPAPG
ncbi:MAG TPA: YbhN family protein [Actinomycetota bacterium]